VISLILRKSNLSTRMQLTFDTLAFSIALSLSLCAGWVQTGAGLNHRLLSGKKVDGKRVESTKVGKPE